MTERLSFKSAGAVRKPLRSEARSDDAMTALDQDRRMIIGECYCCEAKPRALHHCEVAGIETYACAECRGGSLCDNYVELKGELDNYLNAKPKTGEEFERIAAIATALIEAWKDFDKHRGQLGMGE
jgi:hypothetical protein